jgi:hypothetical protein
LQNSVNGAPILNGTPAQAVAKIEDIVFMASVQYENPNLCATLRLVHTEGTCVTGSTDIYRTQIDTQDLGPILNFYASQQQSNTAHRDVFHLFSGTRFTNGAGVIPATIGLAKTGLCFGSFDTNGNCVGTFVNGVLCRTSSMYGIDSMGARQSQGITYNPTLLQQVR